MNVKDVGWSTRAANCLRAYYYNGKVIFDEISTLEELASLSVRDVRARPNVGNVVFSEYEEMLAEHGLSFRDGKAPRLLGPRPWFGFCL